MNEKTAKNIDAIADKMLGAYHLLLDITEEIDKAAWNAKAEDLDALRVELLNITETCSNLAPTIYNGAMRLRYSNFAKVVDGKIISYSVYKVMQKAD